jgi:hypothetical protein
VWSQNGVVHIWTSITWKELQECLTSVISLKPTGDLEMNITDSRPALEIFQARIYKISKVSVHKCILDVRKWTLRGQLRRVNTRNYAPKVVRVIKTRGIEEWTIFLVRLFYDNSKQHMSSSPGCRHSTMPQQCDTFWKPSVVF